MSIIIISRGCYHRGSEVARKAAAELGCDCISREVLLEASTLFDIPELKLMRAIHDAPSLLGRFGHDKKKYVAFIRPDPPLYAVETVKASREPRPLSKGTPFRLQAAPERCSVQQWAG